VRFALVLAAPLLLAGCSASTTDLAPLEWQKVPGTGPGGAVLGFGSPGSFDERGNFTISAFKEGDVIRLYYGGADGHPRHRGRRPLRQFPDLPSVRSQRRIRLSNVAQRHHRGVQLP